MPPRRGQMIETRRKISTSLTGRSLPPEHRERIRDSMRAVWAARRARRAGLVARIAEARLAEIGEVRDGEDEA